MNKFPCRFIKGPFKYPYDKAIMAVNTYSRAMIGHEMIPGYYRYGYIYKTPATAKSGKYFEFSPLEMYGHWWIGSDSKKELKAIVRAVLDREK